MFDKTGTLTVGKPVVVNTKLFKNMVLRDFYELVAATEVGFLLKKLQLSVNSGLSFGNTIYILDLKRDFTRTQERNL